MLKKEKPTMTVAAIIEAQQYANNHRWMEHPLIYNRSSLQFQGSYCKYFH